MCPASGWHIIIYNSILLIQVIWHSPVYDITQKSLTENRNPTSSHIFGGVSFTYFYTADHGLKFSTSITLIDHAGSIKIIVSYYNWFIIEVFINCDIVMMPTKPLDTTKSQLHAHLFTKAWYWVFFLRVSEACKMRLDGACVAVPKQGRFQCEMCLLPARCCNVWLSLCSNENNSFYWSKSCQK